MRSMPFIYFKSASGTLTEPSSCWYRMFKNLSEAEEAEGVLDELGLTPLGEPYDEARRRSGGA